MNWDETEMNMVQTTSGQCVSASDIVEPVDDVIIVTELSVNDIELFS